MPWQYSQRTRVLTHDGRHIGVGYSGKKGIWLNNPAQERVRDKGPIPRGQYRISAAYAHAQKGPVVMTLTPVGHNAHGRTSFMIHGDSRENPGDGSEGCIVLGPTFRSLIAASGDTVLSVVE